MTKINKIISIIICYVFICSAFSVTSVGAIESNQNDVIALNAEQTDETVEFPDSHVKFHSIFKDNIEDRFNDDGTVKSGYEYEEFNVGLNTTTNIKAYVFSDYRMVINNVSSSYDVPCVEQQDKDRFMKLAKSITQITILGKYDLHQGLGTQDSSLIEAKINEVKDRLITIIDNKSGEIQYPELKELIYNGDQTYIMNEFNNCDKLVSLKLPDNLESVGESFTYCGVQTLFLPKTFGCLSDDTGFVKENNEDFRFTVYFESGFESFGINTLGTENTFVKNIIFPNSTEFIDFNKYCNLETITVPSNNNACTALSAFNTSDTGSGEAIYTKDTCSLKGIKFNEGTTRIKARTCEGIYSLTTVYLPSTLRTIEENAFTNLANLKELNIPEGVKRLDREFIYNCEKMQSISIPSTIATVNEGDSSMVYLCPVNRWKDSDRTLEVNVNMTKEQFSTVFGVNSTRPFITDENEYVDQNKKSRIKYSFLSDEVKSLGLQYSIKYLGYRFLYNIEPTIDGQKVVERGGIFGAKFAGAMKEDLHVNPTTNLVVQWAATEKGIIHVPNLNGITETSDTYSITMTNCPTSKISIDADYYARPYAILEDGSIRYGETFTFSIYQICDALYSKQLMNSEENHKWIYDNILTVSNPSYKEVDYYWNNAIVGPF